MTFDIPFLRPNVVKQESYAKYLEQIDSSRIYSNYGPLNTLLEERICIEFFQNEGAVTTVNNATTGLMLAISHCKRPGGKYALMPSFTFAAAPLAAMWCGLVPYFIDIREDDWCMDVEMVEQAVKKLGDEVAVVVPYATFGTWMDLSDYNGLMARGIPVVVDAAASFGTQSESQYGLGFEGPVVFSFHATKAFGIGEGGLIYSKDRRLIEQIRESSNFGFHSGRSSSSLGLNGKLSEYAAAIGLATLDAFPEKKKIRNLIYQTYLEGIQQFQLHRQGWTCQQIHGTIASQFFPILCPPEQTNQAFVQKLATQKIQLRCYFSPACHQQQSFLACPKGSMQVTEDIAKRILSLPLWEEMTSEHVQRVLTGLR